MAWRATKKRREDRFSFPVLLLISFSSLYAMVDYFLTTATQINFTEFKECTDSSVKK